MFPKRTDRICPNCDGQYVWWDPLAFVTLNDAKRTYSAEGAFVCRNCRWFGYDEMEPGSGVL